MRFQRIQISCKMQLCRLVLEQKLATMTRKFDSENYKNSVNSTNCHNLLSTAWSYTNLSLIIANLSLIKFNL